MKSISFTARPAGKRMAAVAMIAAAALSVTACGSSGSGASAGHPASDGSGGATPAGLAAAQAAVAKLTTAPTTISQTTPLASKVPGGKKFFMLYDGNPADTLAKDGARQAVEAAGWSFTALTFKPGDAASIQAAARTALSAHADYIGFNGTDPSLIGTSVLNQIKASGAKIVVGSVYPSTNNDFEYEQAVNGEEYAAKARALADWFVADSGGHGKAYFENVTAFPVLSYAGKVFVQEVKSKCPGCTATVVSFDPSAIENNSIVPTLVSKLRTDSSYKYVLFDYSAFATGIYSAVAAAGLNDVSIGGFGIDSNTIGGLKAGKPGAWVGCSWTYQGWATADLAFRLATNTTDGFDQDQLQPNMIFTPKNASQLDDSNVYANTDFNAPSDAFDQWKKIWGLA